MLCGVSFCFYKFLLFGATGAETCRSRVSNATLFWVVDYAWQSWKFRNDVANKSSIDDAQIQVSLENKVKSLYASWERYYLNTPEKHKVFRILLDRRLKMKSGMPEA